MTAVGSSELYGVNVDWLGEISVTDITELGARWIRMELAHPVFDSAIGAVLQSYHAANIEVLAIVDYSTHANYPTFSSSGPCDGWEQWRSGFLDRIEDVAREFGDRVAAWQVWNEPDHPLQDCGTWYNPGMPPQEYGELLRDATLRIRRHSTSPVITAGLDSGDIGYIKTALRSAAGVRISGVAVHPYLQVPNDSWCAAGSDPGPGLVCEIPNEAGEVVKMPGLGYLLRAYYNATGLPVWVTELGLHSSDEEQQARYVRDAYQTIAKLGRWRIPHAFYFCAADFMHSPYGLMRFDGSKKPAYGAYQQMAGIRPSSPGTANSTTASPATSATTCPEEYCIEGQVRKDRYAWNAEEQTCYQCIDPCGERGYRPGATDNMWKRIESCPNGCDAYTGKCIP